MSRLTLWVFFAILASILAFRFYFFYTNQPQYADGQKVSFETTLLSEPTIVSTRQSISANLASGKKVFIYVPLFPQFHYGETVRISGYVRVITPNVPGTLSIKVLTNKKSIMIINDPKIAVVKNRQNFILSIISIVRQRVILFFQKSLSSIYASLLMGIVFGIQESMPKDFSASLRSAGVYHVIAASGMNVTMVGGFLSFIFSIFLKRQVAVMGAILGILFYTFLAGLEPSIIRASIMGILVFVSQIMGRQRLAEYSLFLTGSIMLFVNPTLLNDIGFQLSFMATLGLLYISPLFGKFWLGKFFGITIAAQLATIPILLANFGTYSFWSIIVNALVLWTVPMLMIIGALGVGIGLIVQPLGQFVLYFSLPFLIYFEKIVVFFAGLPGLITISTISWQLIVGYYILLLAFVLKK